MPIDDPKVQAAIRRQAKAEAWLKLETNETRKELARQELQSAREALEASLQELARRNAAAEMMKRIEADNAADLANTALNEMTGKKAVVQDGPDHIREIKIRG